MVVVIRRLRKLAPFLRLFYGRRPSVKEPLRASSPQHFYCCVPIREFTPFCLSETHRDMGGYFVALLQHPIFKVKLLADDLKGLIEHLAWILIPRRTEWQGRSRVAVRV